MKVLKSAKFQAYNKIIMIGKASFLAALFAATACAEQELAFESAANKTETELDPKEVADSFLVMGYTSDEDNEESRRLADEWIANGLDDARDL